MVIVLASLLAWLGGKELTSKVGSISAAFHKKLAGGDLRRYASLDLQGWHPRVWPSSSFGLGPWDFSCRIPQFRCFYTNFFVNEAHNDYVAVAGEMGALEFGTMVWFLTVMYRHARRKTAKWPTEVTDAATLACSLGVFGILLHSLVDLIPANAAIFFVFCSIATARPTLTPLRKPKPVSMQKTPSPLPKSFRNLRSNPMYMVQYLSLSSDFNLGSYRVY